MKKITLKVFMGILILSTIFISELQAQTCITWMGDEYTTLGTQYLGDNVLFEIQSYPSGDNQGAQVYIDWGNDGYGSVENIDWFNLNYIGSNGNNSKWNASVQMKFVGSHNHRYLGYTTGCPDYVTESFGAFTVTALYNPSNLSAAPTSSSSIDLSWTKWNSKNVMIVRKLSTDSWTEPTQGTAYAVGNSIGSGTVVYNDAGTSFTDSDLLPNTSYDYKFYSENWTYYSAGAISASIITENSTSSDHFRSKATGNWNVAGNWESSPNNNDWVTSSLIPDAQAASITILSGHTITLDENVTISNLTISSGATFIASDVTARTLTLSKSSAGDQSTLNNSGTWSNGTGGSTVVFTGSPSSGNAVHQISGTIPFENVTVNKTGGASNVGASFGVGATVSGTLRIGAGGYISTDPPTNFYGSDATLDFNQGEGSTYTVNIGDKSWSTTQIPNNITITTGTVELNEARSFSGLLQVQNGATLKTNGNLTLKSDENASASILNSGAITGDITFQRYLTNYTLQTDAKYHFISSPVLSQAIQPGFVANPPAAEVDFYKFDEEINTWINSKEGTTPNFTWVEAFGNNFEVGKGYLVAYPDAPVTKEFSGTLNNEESYPLDCTHTDGKGNGWNLLGNPYPAAIDWDEVTLGDGMDNALYYYDAANQNYNYYIKLDADDPTTALGTGTQYIPAMQGFMVHAKSSGTKTVTIEKADLTHTGQNVFYKSTTNLVSGSLSLKVSGNGHEDQTFIHFNENASIEFDGSYDAYKLKSTNPIIPMIYTTNESGVEFAINGLPKIQEGTTIPLALQIGEAGEYTIQAMINGVETNLFLEDLFTGESTKLNDNPTYSFTSSSSDSPDRFLLHFGVVGIGEQDQATTLHAYAYNNRLYVNNSLEQAQIAVYDLQGRLLMQQSANASGLQSLPLDLPAGVYVVRLSNAQEAKSVKINVQ